MDNALAFFIPHHGRPKISLRVPESHSLHVCPAACGRRNGLRALKNGEAEHLSFLYITETDVISGEYERIIGSAIEELLEVLEPEPKAFLIYVNCIDDFLGTDEQALLQELRARFPKLRFTICHIDPVAADGPVPPGARMQDRLYSLLEPEKERENSVNLIGNFVLPDREGELYALLNAWGISTVRHLPGLESYSEFQRMAAARLNLVLMAMGRYAAQQMEQRLGIPWLELPVSYSLEEVERGYREIASALHCSPEGWEEARESAQQAVTACVAQLKGVPVLVDSSAAMRPFAMAKALAEYGFQVGAVFITHGKEEDRAEREWLESNHPETKIIWAGRYDGAGGWQLPRESMAIGFDVAYSIRAKHFVDLQRDETLFGFHGIRTLMDWMLQASKQETRWD